MRIIALFLLCSCGAELPAHQPMGAPMPVSDDWNANGAGPTVWGTDVAKATDEIYEGDSSWKFPSTSSVAGRLDSDFIAIPQGAPFEVALAARVSNVAQHVNLVAQFHDKILAAIGSEDIEWTLTAANSWEIYRKILSGARAANQEDARFVKITVGKKASGAYDLWLTPLALDAAKRSFRVHDDSGAQAIASGSFQLVDFDTIDYDNGGVVTTGVTTSKWDPGTYAGGPNTANKKTLWHFDAAVTLDDLKDGGFLRCALFVNGTEAARGPAFTGGAVSDPTATVSADLRVSESDVVDVRVHHDHGSNRNTVPGSATVYFSGHEF